MPLPPSVTKSLIKKGNVELTFTDNVDRVNYTLRELVRRANIDVGKYIVKIIQQKVRAESKFLAGKKGEGKLVHNYRPRRYQYWARPKENDLQIGVENTKYGANSAWWADQAELGTNGRKWAFMHDTVLEHIDDIRSIQAKYLSAIEDAIEAERIAAETESMGTEADDLGDTE